MEIDKIELFVGKRIKIILKNNYTYVGNLESLDDNFLYIEDKYDKKVFINKDEIKVIEEVFNG